MLNYDKLSYRAYGNIMIFALIVIALLMNLFPFSFKGLVLCLVQIPWYLYVRFIFNEPIHANGLNRCCVATIVFFMLLFISAKAMLFLIDNKLACIFTFSLTMLCCYLTSTMPNVQEQKGKLFYGYKKHDESKYQKLIDYIKFNGIDPMLIEAEKRLAEIDTQSYLLYKRKFREDKTFQEMVDEFDIENPRIVEILDKDYFYMIGALKL